MAKRKPLTIKTKKPKPIHWFKHTVDETRAIQVFLDAFGPLVSYRDFPNVQRGPWMGRRCPECDTRYEPDTWPKCQWCRARDPREASLRYLYG